MSNRQQAMLDHYELVENLEDKARTTQRRIKVRLDSLCATCQNSHIYRSKRHNTPMVVCGYGRDKVMPIDIEECNHYLPVGQLDISTLAKMAVMIEKDEKHTPGFKIPTIGGQ